MTTKWLELLQNAHHNIDCDVSDLRNIAKVLRRVGSEGLADEIMDIAYGLNKSSRNISKALDLKTTADVKGAYAMTGTLFNTLIEKAKREGTMSNMSYCRFHNTLLDLRDCQKALNGEDDYYLKKEDLSEEEQSCALSLIKRCREIVEAYDNENTILNRDMWGE